MFAVYFGAGVRFFDQVEPFPFTFSSLFPEAGTFTFVMILSMAAMGMYQQDSRRNIKDTLFRLMPSIMLGFGIMTLIFYLAARPLSRPWNIGTRAACRLARNSFDPGSLF